VGQTPLAWETVWKLNLDEIESRAGVNHPSQPERHSKLLDCALIESFSTSIFESVNLIPGVQSLKHESLSGWEGWFTPALPSLSSIFQFHTVF
jgi:hypothetical protein